MHTTYLQGFCIVFMRKPASCIILLVKINFKQLIIKSQGRLNNSYYPFVIKSALYVRTTRAGTLRQMEIKIISNRILCNLVPFNKQLVA